MIIEYTRNAKCKDCKYCGYFYLTKKDGSTSFQKRHKCVLKDRMVCANDLVCDDWKISFSGIPDSVWKIENSFSECSID